jgi:hypothetical protein
VAPSMLPVSDPDGDPAGMGTIRQHLHAQLTQAQSKHTYFLLAVSASAVALAVHQTEARALAISLIPLGLAVLSWAGSFYCGCMQLSYVAATLRANAALFEVQAGNHPQIGHDVQRMAAASDGIREAAESNAANAGRYHNSQFRLLLLGAILYIAWHVLEMALRTAPPGPQ